MPELRTTQAGTPITAVDEGSGPALLVVHPGGQDIGLWGPVARLLSSDFRVVRIRRRLYARAPGAPATGDPTLGRDHSMAVEAADILAIARLLDPPILLVGHSSGAVAALEAALRAPDTFAGLCLYEPPLPTRSLVGGPALARARQALQSGDPVEAMRIHLCDIAQLPGAMIEPLFANPASRAAFAAFAAPQLADTQAIDALGVGIDRYRSLDLPAVLLEGDRSPSHLRERLADLAATLPRARVVTLAGQGHLAHVTAPAVLAAEIRKAATSVFAPSPDLG